jgi:hypothetical protein
MFIIAICDNIVSEPTILKASTAVYQGLVDEHEYGRVRAVLFSEEAIDNKKFAKKTAELLGLGNNYRAVAGFECVTIGSVIRIASSIDINTGKSFVETANRGGCCG